MWRDSRNSNVFTNIPKCKAKSGPLKGAILTPLVYKDYGLRMMSDLDFLIHPDDRKNASSLLKKEGFIIGKYDWAAPIRKYRLKEKKK